MNGSGLPNNIRNIKVDRNYVADRHQVALRKARETLPELPVTKMLENSHMEAAILKYLSISGMVLVPKEPTQEMKAAWYSDLEPWFNEKIEAEWHMWNVMLDAAPNPFKSKP